MFKVSVRVGQDDRLRRVSEIGSGRVFLGPLLRDALPGIRSRQTNFMRLRRLDRDETIYSQYRGGFMWKPSARGLGLKGEEFPLAVNVLTREEFVKGVDELRQENDVGARWVAEKNCLKVGCESGKVMIRCSQAPAIEGCSRFVLSGRTSQFFRGYNECVRLDFAISGLLGNRRSLALFHDGRGTPWMGIKCGGYFSRIYIISSDGVRIRFIYGHSREFNIAVLYESDPRSLYTIRWDEERSADFAGVKRDAGALGEVNLARRLEQRMESEGTAYDHGRLGAEIAYAAASELLRPGQLAIPEPSRGGRDLFSIDGRVVIQARMLVRTRDMNGARLKDELSRNMRNLLNKLGQDFRFNHSAEYGLAVLTFLDTRHVLRLVTFLRTRTHGIRRIRVPFELL